MAGKLGPKNYTVTAEIEFSVIAMSVPDAYAKVNAWITKAFNDSFANGPTPDAVPNYFEGLSVVKDSNG